MSLRYSTTLLLSLICAASAWAGYKAKPWSVKDRDSYPARLTSEEVTIGVQPLYTDAQAKEIFDIGNMVTRGIMPLAVAIFNDNDFPVEVRTESIRLLDEGSPTETLDPYQAVTVITMNQGKSVWIPNPLPRGQSAAKIDLEALKDFENKFLGRKIVPPRSSGGGFLYMRFRDTTHLKSILSRSLLYIPDVIRADTGDPMIFFEIELQPAVSVETRPQ